MNPIDQVKEALLDKGFSEMGATSQMWWRGLFPSLIIHDPPLLYMSEESYNKLKRQSILREQKRREKLAEEYLIEINYMRPQWNNIMAQY